MNKNLRAGPGDVIGRIPYRMAFAGGWIDQPFVSSLDPSPPGSMVVVQIEPDRWYMERSGGALPDRDPAELTRELYAAENEGRAEPSGSQDMIGLIYPGINRLDYDVGFEGGYFPRHIESCREPAVARWLERVIHMVAVAPRPPGYNPLGEQHLDPAWVRRLGQSGRDCYDAILAMDADALGASMNECMRCWEALLPHTVRHPTVTTDLAGLLAYYQNRYPGAMYSGCGGGYLYVVSKRPVPGGFRVKIRLKR
jgi:hypothetical protein